MSPRIVTTNDGSSTLYSERYRQHYHNMSGALTESRHVFFDRTGITDALAYHRNFTICEVGFGTGFHVLLLERLHRETGSQSRIQYHSVEKYPISGDLIRQMGFTDLFVRSDATDDFHPLAVSRNQPGGPGASSAPADRLRVPETPVDSLIRFSDALVLAESGTTIRLDLPSITIRVFRGDFYDWDLSKKYQERSETSQVYLQDLSGSSKTGGTDASAASVDFGIGPVHFFLFDAFSPENNPELWTPAVFSKLLTIADNEAVLGTYCSATRARAAMVHAGWHVARAVGPPGKREMTLASPGEDPLDGYKRVNEARLRKRFRDTW